MCAITHKPYFDGMEKLVKKISSTLKAIRKESGWSLDKASQKTGVSKAMLGQIERGESSPTISTLWKIAAGFEVSFSSFVDDINSTNSKVVHRSGKTKEIHPSDNKIKVFSLFPFDKKLSFEAFIIELLPGCEHLSPPHQKGVIEHIIVSEGKMEVLVKGKWKLLKEKEGLKFNADQPHGYRNLNSSKAVILDLIHYK